MPISGVVVNTSGQSRSFQLFTNVKIASVSSAGTAFGSTMLRNTRNSLAPSIRAALSRSRGRAMKNCRRKKMPNASAARGMISPANVLTQPRCADQLVDRDERRLERDHQARDDDDQQHAGCPRKSMPRERVRRERVEDQGEHRDPAGEDETVQEQPAERQVAEDLGEVVQRPGAGQQCRRVGVDLGGGLESGEHDDDHRQQHDEGQHEGRGEEEPAFGGASDPRGGAERRSAARCDAAR